MIQAWPDRFLQEMNEVDIIIGKPILYNYYTLFDVTKGRIGFYKADYNRTFREFSAGAVACFGLFGIIIGAGLFACYYKSQKLEPMFKVNVRGKKEKNVQRQIEEGAVGAKLAEGLIEEQEFEE